ncbi:hypothetical protein HRK28_15345 [Rathayibacter sp. VKM Ac-2835]|uniref:hypothetical protein n=1 Tax=Rathayibacter sp. VKM Ac-2835 TaxID=2739043 RepID=UPI0015660CF9|nr:hypothetical protein [Rathayibacter sp. VKM Ac-2835]NRG42288.1 hypothetical protein [Rathayibacter sp. VKM Ac-2835]
MKWGFHTGDEQILPAVVLDEISIRRRPRPSLSSPAEVSAISASATDGLPLRRLERVRVSVL